MKAILFLSVLCSLGLADPLPDPVADPGIVIQVRQVIGSGYEDNVEGVVQDEYTDEEPAGEGPDDEEPAGEGPDDEEPKDVATEEPPPIVCEAPWRDMDGYCYLLSDDGNAYPQTSATYEDAKAACENMFGGQLAILDTAEKRDALFKLLYVVHGDDTMTQGLKQWHVGAEKLNGEWTWLDGSQVDQAAWNADKGMPDNGNSCAGTKMLLTVGEENDILLTKSCGEYPFICGK